MSNILMIFVLLLLQWLLHYFFSKSQNLFQRKVGVCLEFSWNVSGRKYFRVTFSALFLPSKLSLTNLNSTRFLKMSPGERISFDTLWINIGPIIAIRVQISIQWGWKVAVIPFWLVTKSHFPETLFRYSIMLQQQAYFLLLIQGKHEM